MQSLISILLLSLFLVACDKENSSPTLEKKTPPAALQEVVDAIPSCACLPQIHSYTWRGEFLYVLTYAGPACLWVPAYYQADGEPKVMPTGYDYAAFLAEATNKELVWECAIQ